MFIKRVDLRLSRFQLLVCLVRIAKIAVKHYQVHRQLNTIEPSLRGRSRQVRQGSAVLRCGFRVAVVKLCNLATNRMKPVELWVEMRGASQERCCTINETG